MVFLEADAFYDCALACVVFTFKKNEARPYMIDVIIEPISFFSLCYHLNLGITLFENWPT